MRGMFFLEPMPRPTTTSTSASVRVSCAAAVSTPRLRTRASGTSPSATSSTEPVRDASSAGAENTPGRTVAIWGRCAGQTIVAIRLPPKAGRVCWRSPACASTSSTVQSAVRPVCRRCATAGASTRPKTVAP